jgi:hypothetical protein
VHGESVAAGYVALTLAYGLLYATVLLVAACAIFSRRDLK